jgi:integrase
MNLKKDFLTSYQGIPVNINTSRALAIAKRDYRAFIDGSYKKDLATWANNMHSRGLSVNTIRQRICLVRRWLGIEENIVLPTRRNIREGKWLTPKQVQAILAVIPNNDSGWRDFALIAVLLIAGLRIGQVRNLRWCDLHLIGRIATEKKMNFPKVIFDLLQLIRMQHKDSYPSNMLLLISTFDENYLFAATYQHRSRQIHSSNNPKKQPFSPQEINRRICRYARLAGLETQGINAECLRRTHKELGENTIITLVQNSLMQRKAGPVRWKQIDRDARLHGIGRRGHRV